MIYVTGDTHGDFARFDSVRFPQQNEMSRADYVIVCGDFGGLFYGGKTDERKLDALSQKNFTLLFLDGNHENFPILNSFPVSDWMGGRVHRIRENVIHLMRGEVFSIDGQSFFVMGGGHSFDKMLRVKDLDWWEEEMPSDAEYKNAVSNLTAVDFKTDYILTHTAPLDTLHFLATPFGHGHNPELTLNSFLEWVRENVSYKHWYFGHFHVEKTLWRNQMALYDGIVRIK